MSKDNRYLSASVPKVKKASESMVGGARSSVTGFSALEERLDALNEQMIRQNRDNLDAAYNVDEDNLSENLLGIIRDLQKRVTALEEIINGE